MPQETKIENFTEVNDDLIPPGGKAFVIVAAVELGERGQAGGAHPILEVLVILEVGRRLGLGVAAGEARGPIGRRRDLAEVILGLAAILLLLAWPRDAVVAEVVSGCVVVHDRQVGEGV